MDPNIRIAKVEVPDSEAKLAVTIIGEIRRIVGASSSEHTVDALSNHIDPGNVHRAFATNKTRIYDAISAGHDAAGLKRHKKAAFDRVRSEVEEAGGITTKTTERWARRWPGK